MTQLLTTPDFVPHARPPSGAPLTPMRAIRAKCLDCSGGSAKEARLCPVMACALWPYRMGRRPRASEKTGTYVPDFSATRGSGVEAQPDGGAR